MCDKELLKITAKLWSAAYDLLLYDKGQSQKTLDEIEQELDVLEYRLRPYAELDDLEFPGH